MGLDKNQPMAAPRRVREKLKSHLVLALKLSLSAALIFWLIQTDRLPLKDLNALLNPAVLAWGLFWLGGTFFIASERWRMLLNYQGIPATSVTCFKLTLVGLFFGFFLPGGVGGDVVKAYYVVQNLEGAKTQAIGSVLFDRLIGLFSMTLFCLAALLIGKDQLLSSPSLQPLIFLVIAMFVAFCSLFLALWSRRFHALRSFILKLSERLPFARRNLERLLSFKLVRAQFLKLVGVSLLTQACNFVFFMGLPYFLGYPEVSLTALLFAVPLGFIATAVPISPGGVGVGQAAFFFLYTLVLQQETQLGSISVTLFQAFSILYGLVGALFYLSLGRPKRILVD